MLHKINGIFVQRQNLVVGSCMLLCVSACTCTQRRITCKHSRHTCTWYLMSNFLFPLNEGTLRSVGDIMCGLLPGIPSSSFNFSRFMSVAITLAPSLAKVYKENRNIKCCHCEAGKWRLQLDNKSYRRWHKLERFIFIQTTCTSHKQTTTKLCTIKCKQIVKIQGPVVKIKPNSLDNKDSWKILLDFYCSVTIAQGVRVNVSSTISSEVWLQRVNFL